MIGGSSHVARRARKGLAAPEAGAGMLVRRITVAPADVVFVKGILEASEGVATMFAERGGELVIAAPHDRAADLSELVDDLVRDLGARLEPDVPASAGAEGAP